MIILRQKIFFSPGIEYKTINKLKGIKQTPGARRWNKETAIGLEKAKRKAVNSVVDTVNNPAGFIIKQGAETLYSPLKKASQVALVAPVPGGIVAGGVGLKASKFINQKTPLGKVSRGIQSTIEKQPIYQKSQKWNLKLLKRPYKVR